MVGTYTSAQESSFRKRLDSPSLVINFKSQSDIISLLCKNATSSFDSFEFILLDLCLFSPGIVLCAYAWGIWV